MPGNILISVIIPTKNAENWLVAQRNSFLSQTLFHQTEFIYIDSGSTDNTIAIIKTFSNLNFKLLQIKPNDFNHGDTRNFGVLNAKGTYVVMTVQDAKPTSPKWLEFLLEGFTDNNVAGVCGQQIVPHDSDKNPVEWFRPVSEPGKKRIEFSNSLEYNRLSPENKKSNCSWDDVNAIYRKDILMLIPFKRTNFGEDAQWAQDALLRGYAIAYNSEAQVDHYHHEFYGYTFKRTIAVFYSRYLTFGFIPNKSRISKRIRFILGNIKTLLGESSISWTDKFKWLKYNLTKQRAINDALKTFHSAIKIGNSEVDKIYYTFCEKVPMAGKVKI